MAHHKSYFFLGFAFLQAINVAYGANILYLSSVTSPSHYIWYALEMFLVDSVDYNFFLSFNRNSAFVNGLAARSHNITVISPDRDKNPPNGVHYIHMEGLYNEFYDEIVKSAFVPHESNPFEMTIEFFDYYMTSICKGSMTLILSTAGLATLIAY